MTVLRHRTERTARAARRSLAGLAVLGACLLAAGGPGGAAEPWLSPLGRAHPLAGRIWDTAGATFVDAPTLVARLASARFVLLGEKHDNADHHRLQARVLGALVAAGRRPAVAFEMFAADDQGAIDRHLAAAPTDAAGLADAVDWQRSGWPAWAMYQPIAEVALAAALPVVAANLSRAATRALMQGGPDALEPAARVRLGFDRPLPPPLQADLADELQRAHCGHAPLALLERMRAVQHARDAHMAASLVEHGGPSGGVLIAGAGHVRADRGVPFHLRALAPASTAVSVALVEVRDALDEPAAYAVPAPGGVWPFDYVWFTPRVDDHDPCQRFRKPLEGLRDKP